VKAGELRRIPTREADRNRGGACGKPVVAEVFDGGVDPQQGLYSLCGSDPEEDHTCSVVFFLDWPRM
jgi:hypothetical protein